MTPYMNAVKNAVIEVGKEMLYQSQNTDALSISPKQANDFVTDVDLFSEAAITEAILKRFPDHGIKTEEAGFKGNASSDFIWILDPLDGTCNYIHGLDQYCISLALLEKGKLLDALVYHPASHTSFMAERGRGAYCNNSRMRVSKRGKATDFLMATGFPVVDHSVTDDYLKILKEVIKSTSGARREGSAALDLCSVALGKYDGFFEFRLKPWDIAAGMLIVKEAGGYVSDFAGGENSLESGDIIAGNGKAHAFLLDIIKNVMEQKKQG